MLSFYYGWTKQEIFDTPITVAVEMINRITSDLNDDYKFNAAIHGVDLGKHTNQESEKAIYSKGEPRDIGKYANMAKKKIEARLKKRGNS
jgi:hypothetical protein